MLRIVVPVLFLASGVTPAVAAESEPPADEKPLPCADAAEVVAGSLVGDVPSDLSSWPLYEVELEVSVETREIEGRMQVTTLSPASGLKHLTLLLPPAEESGGSPPVTVRSARVRMGQEGDLEHRFVRASGVRVEVPLPRPTHEGELITMLLELEGTLALRRSGNITETMGIVSGPVGPGTIGAIATDGEGVRLLGAHPVLAPYHEGGFRQAGGVPFGPSNPSPPACHIMSLLAPSSLSPVYIGELVGQVPEPDGRTRSTFVAAGARRMAVVLSPPGLETVERTIGEVTIRSSAKEASTAREMTQWAAGVLRHFERRLGPYPWTRLEIVEAPMTGAVAGLRAPGILLINDMVGANSSLLVGLGAPGMDSFLQELAIAHQLAHQWYGELIDLFGVESPAVEKALAWHAVLDYARTRHGAGAARRIRERMLELGYHVWRFSGGADAPAGAPLEEILELGGIGAYLGLCEGKAPVLMEEIARKIGRGSLRNALRRFADASRFSGADRASVEEAVRAAAGEEEARVAQLFARWLDETRGDEDLGGPDEALSRMLMQELGGGRDLDGPMQEMLEQMLRQLGGLSGP